jgi:hypothetical protein
VYRAADGTDPDVYLTASEWRLPVFRIIRFVVEKLLGTRSHTLTKCFREAFKRILGHAQCGQTGIGETDTDPGVVRSRPIGGGIDVGQKPPDQLTTVTGILDVQ